MQRRVQQICTSLRSRQWLLAAWVILQLALLNPYACLIHCAAHSPEHAQELAAPALICVLNTETAAPAPPADPPLVRSASAAPQASLPAVVQASAVLAHGAGQPRQPVRSSSVLTPGALRPADPPPKA